MTEPTETRALIAETREHAKDHGWYPSRQECLDLADALERATRGNPQPSDEGWTKTLSDYRAAGWEGDDPDDHERMFWEAGFKQGVAALRATRDVS